jgi:parallel beta-helix repeat protein
MTMILMFASVVAVAQSVHVVQASGTVHVRPDGSIDPPGAPISSADNVTYVLTDNVFNESIIIERDDIIFDGAGHAVQGTRVSSSKGISLYGRSNVTISRVQVNNFTYGIWLSLSYNITVSGNNLTANANDGITLREYSSNNTIVANNIAANRDGIYFWNSSNNTVARNRITDSTASGIELFEAADNLVMGNRMENCGLGIFMSVSSDCSFYQNSFVNNTEQAAIYFCNSTVWDHDSEGNYWNDYDGVDLNNDGIGDVFHEIDESSMDRPSLMGAFYDFPASPPSAPGNETYRVTIISNSTVSDFKLVDLSSPTTGSLQQAQAYITFNASGTEGDGGFCRIMFPRELMNDSYSVFVNRQEVNFTELPISDETHAYPYFTYSHSTLDVIVIPEFQSLVILLPFITAAVCAALLSKRKRRMLYGCLTA